MSGSRLPGGSSPAHAHQRAESSPGPKNECGARNRLPAPAVLDPSTPAGRPGAAEGRARRPADCLPCPPARRYLGLSGCSRPARLPRSPATRLLGARAGAWLGGAAGSGVGGSPGRALPAQGPPGAGLLLVVIPARLRPRRAHAAPPRRLAGLAQAWVGDRSPGAAAHSEADPGVLAPRCAPSHPQERTHHSALSSSPAAMQGGGGLLMGAS